MSSVKIELEVLRKTHFRIYNLLFLGSTTLQKCKGFIGFTVVFYFYDTVK